MKEDIIVNPPGPAVQETGFWVDADGNYYEGDRRPGSTAIARKPGMGYDIRGGKWVFDPKLAAQAAITIAESQQTSVLTPRALREAVLAAFEASGKTSARVYTDLKTIDDAIAAERGKL